MNEPTFKSWMASNLDQLLSKDSKTFFNLPMDFSIVKKSLIYPKVAVTVFFRTPFYYKSFFFLLNITNTFHSLASVLIKIDSFMIAGTFPNLVP
jgi:hypothetical protein